MVPSVAVNGFGVIGTTQAGVGPFSLRSCIRSFWHALCGQRTGRACTLYYSVIMLLSCKPSSRVGVVNQLRWACFVQC